MSNSLLKEAWQSNVSSGAKLVLLALADAVNNDDIDFCWISVPNLAKKCSMGERTVQGHLSDLERLGAITREMRDGRSTVYRLNPSRFCTPADFAPPQISHHTPADFAPTPAESAPITIKEPEIEPEIEIDIPPLPPKPKKQGKVESDERFAQFWAAYPRKCSKGQAERTFAKINPDECLLAAILDGIKRAMTLDRRFADAAYTPHASTWLNAKGWEDQFDASHILPKQPALTAYGMETGGKGKRNAAGNSSAVEEVLRRMTERHGSTVIEGEFYEQI